MRRTQECLICGGSTELGFVLDKVDNNSRNVEEWWAGKPEHSFWLRVKKPDRTFKVATRRCVKRGFLMEFANPDEAGS